MKSTETDQNFDNVIQHLTAKVLARAQAGKYTIRLTVSPDRHRAYSGQLQVQLGKALETAGTKCSIMQWTGAGHTGVLEVVIDPA